MADIVVRIKKLDGRFYELTPANGLKTYESYSQSNPDAGKIFYGVVPNTGEITAVDLYGELKGLCELRQIIKNETKVEIWENGKKRATHIINESPTFNGTEITLSLTNSLAYWDKIKYPGQGHIYVKDNGYYYNGSLYDVLINVLKAVPKSVYAPYNTPEEKIASMRLYVYPYSQKEGEAIENMFIIGGAISINTPEYATFILTRLNGQTGEMSVEGYLKSITVKSNYMSESSLREAMDKILIVAGWQCYENENGEFVFANATPKAPTLANSFYYSLNLSHFLSTPQSDLLNDGTPKFSLSYETPIIKQPSSSSSGYGSAALSISTEKTAKTAVPITSSTDVVSLNNFYCNLDGLFTSGIDWAPSTDKTNISYVYGQYRMYFVASQAYRAFNNNVSCGSLSTSPTIKEDDMQIAIKYKKKTGTVKFKATQAVLSNLMLSSGNMTIDSIKTMADTAAISGISDFEETQIGDEETGESSTDFSNYHFLIFDVPDDGIDKGSIDGEQNGLSEDVYGDLDIPNGLSVLGEKVVSNNLYAIAEAVVGRKTYFVKWNGYVTVGGDLTIFEPSRDTLLEFSGTFEEIIPTSATIKVGYTNVTLEFKSAQIGDSSNSETQTLDIGSLGGGARQYYPCGTIWDFPSSSENVTLDLSSGKYAKHFNFDCYLPDFFLYDFINHGDDLKADTPLYIRESDGTYNYNEVNYSAAIMKEYIVKEASLGSATARLSATYYALKDYHRGIIKHTVQVGGSVIQDISPDYFLPTRIKENIENGYSGGIAKASANIIKKDVEVANMEEKEIIQAGDYGLYEEFWWFGDIEAHNYFIFNAEGIEHAYKKYNFNASTGEIIGINEFKKTDTVKKGDIFYRFDVFYWDIYNYGKRVLTKCIAVDNSQILSSGDTFVKARCVSRFSVYEMNGYMLSWQSSGFALYSPNDVYKNNINKKSVTYNPENRNITTLETAEPYEKLKLNSIGSYFAPYNVNNSSITAIYKFNDKIYITFGDGSVAYGLFAIRLYSYRCSTYKLVLDDTSNDIIATVNYSDISSSLYNIEVNYVNEINFPDKINDDNFNYSDTSVKFYDKDGYFYMKTSNNSTTLYKYKYEIKNSFVGGKKPIPEGAQIENEPLKWENGEVLKIGDFVRLDKDNNNDKNSNMFNKLFRVSGVTHKYDGVPVQDLELEEIK